MPPDSPIPPHSPDDRRSYYRITVVLPVSIQDETDTGEEQFAEQSVNISGGGIGVTVSKRYDPKAILVLRLSLPDQVILKAFLEVVAVEPITTSRLRTYRVRGRFIRMSAQDRELLIRYIMRVQRDHLQRHYMA
jgi:c-di-GMP-binding flagellar brake protein YcgR